MSAITRLATRRRVLKGMIGGTVVSVALPLLDSFVNSNGTALANGAPLPLRFGTWYWGCGLRPGRWEPQQVGEGYEMPEHLKSLVPFKDRISIFSGMNASLDGNPLRVHWSGARSCAAGEVLDSLPTIDVVISDAIGGTTRFRSLEVAANAGTGPAPNNPANSISRRNATLINASETSAAALYARIFGPDFHDPNAADFKADPRIMVRKSVLSAISEPRESLLKDLGAADRRRLDEYFTSVRELEHQVSLQLEKPAPLEACSRPNAPQQMQLTTDVEQASANHALLVSLLAHALSCDQTRVINVYFTGGELTKLGDTSTHHINTHEEPIDERLGYQVKVGWYEEFIMENFATMLRALDSIKEADGTLLDHSLIYAFSECGLAQTHSVQNIPMFLAGRAGGRLKTGRHIAANDDPVTRVGLTIQRLLGVTTTEWGTGSMRTGKPFTEIIADQQTS